MNRINHKVQFNSKQNNMLVRGYKSKQSNMLAIKRGFGYSTFNFEENEIFLIRKLKSRDLSDLVDSKNHVLMQGCAWEEWKLQELWLTQRVDMTQNPEMNLQEWEEYVVSWEKKYYAQRKILEGELKPYFVIQDYKKWDWIRLKEAYELFLDVKEGEVALSNQDQLESRLIAWHFLVNRVNYKIQVNKALLWKISNYFKIYKVMRFVWIEFKIDMQTFFDTGKVSWKDYESMIRERLKRENLRGLEEEIGLLNYDYEENYDFNADEELWDNWLALAANFWIKEEEEESSEDLEEEMEEKSSEESSEESSGDEQEKEMEFSEDEDEKKLKEEMERLKKEIKEEEMERLNKEMEEEMERLNKEIKEEEMERLNKEIKEFSEDLEEEMEEEESSGDEQEEEEERLNKEDLEEKIKKSLLDTKGIYELCSLKEHFQKLNKIEAIVWDMPRVLVEELNSSLTIEEKKDLDERIKEELELYDEDLIEIVKELGMDVEEWLNEEIMEAKSNWAKEITQGIKEYMLEIEEGIQHILENRDNHLLFKRDVMGITLSKAISEIKRDSSMYAKVSEIVVLIKENIEGWFKD